MSYEANVATVCAELGISDPRNIAEDSLRIREMIFFRGKEVLARIEATDMNRAGRLLVQYIEQRPTKFEHPWRVHDHADPIAPYRMRIGECERTFAQKYFADRWDDAEKVGRPLIIAFKQCDCIGIKFKS